MKTIVDGKRFDTETSELVGVWHNDTLLDDFGRVIETLHVTAAKTFFLHCAGELNRYPDALARQYGIRNPDNSVYGELIVPLAATEALDWAVAHLGTEVVEKYFGEMIADA